MRKPLSIGLASIISIPSFFIVQDSALAAPKPKVVINKPSAPTIESISSSAPKRGKVNLTISIRLPADNGGAVITGSKVTAKGASCSMTKLKTTCTVKNVKIGKSFSFVAQSKNKKGFGGKSIPVAFTTDGSNWTKPAPTPTPTQTQQSGYSCSSGHTFVPCYCLYVNPASTHYNPNGVPVDGKMNATYCTGAISGAYSWVDYCRIWFALGYDPNSKSCSGPIASPSVTPTPSATSAPIILLPESTAIMNRINYIDSNLILALAHSLSVGAVSCAAQIQTIMSNFESGYYYGLHSSYRRSEMSEYSVIEILNPVIDKIIYCKNI